MRPAAEIPRSDSGFTLIEIIATILLGSVLAALMFQFMGTALKGSSGPVDIVRDGAGMEALMEEIIADYVLEINDTTNDPPNDALDAIVTGYGSDSRVSLRYITFDAGGAEQPAGGAEPGTPATDTLKVTVQSAGHSLVTLLTKSRANTDDPVSKF